MPRTNDSRHAHFGRQLYGGRYGTGEPTTAKRELRKLLLLAPLTLVFLMLIAASAAACLTLPSTSTWTGDWGSRSGHSGTWSATVMSTQTSPGVWTIQGNGTVDIFGYGSAPGHLKATLTCTGPTTDSQTGEWQDNFGDNVITTGSLSINSSGALENGGWSGPTIASPSDSGSWEGRFAATTTTEQGTVEVESSPGTLINTLTTEVASSLPLLPPGDVAPVGGVSFAANLPLGATIKVKLILPPGSNPTNLFKLVNGMYEEVPATIVGDTVEFAITDGGEFDEDRAVNGEVIDPVIPISRLHVEATELPAATRGQPYSTQLAAASGTSPYKWKKVGKLPKGLKLSKTGLIHGTPSSKLAPGSYPVGVKVTDSKKGTATATLMLRIN